MRYSNKIKYPKKIKNNNNIYYYFVKEYNNYAIYSSKGGIRECFTPAQAIDIMLKKEKVQVGV